MYAESFGALCGCWGQSAGTAKVAHQVPLASKDDGSYERCGQVGAPEEDEDQGFVRICPALRSAFFTAAILGIPATFATAM